MKNNTSALWDYLAKHPFAHYDKDLRVGDGEFMVLILGCSGPQGKSTLERICDECGIEHTTYVRGWNRDISIRPMKRVLVVDFGDRFLTKAQMDAYNGKGNGD